MKETIAEKIAEMSYYQIMEMIGFLVLCVLALIITSAVVLDKLDVKSFSFRTGFTFYDDGDVKRTRITRRKKTVARKRKAIK